ncbi:MAG: NAD(P)H-dependent oxidoreductase subunit E [Candidatus Sericytochromatia bacterium]|nr:NAD(P)H-dependent oxidoreductase subunit E [Candidatus Tanganyikabacteria bacterium]
MDGIGSILEKHRDQRFGFMSVLGEIQTRYGYLPADALKRVAQATGRSLSDIYGVATFYRAFSLTPRGKHVTAVCVGTACHVRGAKRLAEEMERHLGIRAGETTPDREITLEAVNCLGACALGPIVVADGHYVSKVDNHKARNLLDKLRGSNGHHRGPFDSPVFPVTVSCPRCNHGLMTKDHLIDGHPAIHVTVSFGLHYGWMRLSSLYGSFTIESEHEIPLDVELELFCPHCHAELVGASPCPECAAHMVPMLVRGGGVVQICARRGCKSHRLDLGGSL